MIKLNKNTQAFTLIELLIVIAIIVLLMAISIFGLTGARESSRDQRRKTDLETVRSALELYRSDCDRYPANNEVSAGGSLRGTQSTGGKCLTSYTYLQTIPSDPQSGSYRYTQTGSGSGYELCSTLEKPPSGASVISCGGSTTCGSGSCYYRVTNP